MAKAKNICLAVTATSAVVWAGWRAYRWYQNREARVILKAAEDEVKLVVSGVYPIDDITEATEDVIVGIKTGVNGSEPIVKRRVHRKGSFVTHLVAIGKAKFGCPTHTAANTMCVRKFLYDYCTDNSVLPRHIATFIDSAVEMVFVISDSELVAKAVRHTKVARRRADLQGLFGGPAPTC